MRISVRGSEELTAVVLAYKRLPRTLRNQVNRQMRANLGPIWQAEVRKRIKTPMDQKVIGSGVRVKPGNPSVVMAAQSRRAIGGRLVPQSDFQGWEFGAGRDRVTTYRRKSKKGGTHTVKRHTTRQMPAPARSGRVAYPALAEAAPRLAALQVQTVVRALHDAAEGVSD